MARNKNKLCCFCKKTVLGIYGQDDVLDTYNLLQEELDKKAVAEKIFGSCHMTCLLRSPWNDFWLIRRLGNYMNPRGFVQIYEEQEGRIFRDHRTGQSVIVLSSGAMFLLSDRHIKIGLRAATCSIGVTNTERFWELPASQRRARMEELFDAATCSIGVTDTQLFWELPASQRRARMEELFDADGYMPLLQLAQYFDVQDTFRDNDQAAKTRLQAVAGKTAETLGKGFLIVDVHCAVTLPRRLLSQLVAHVSPQSLPLIPSDWSPPKEVGDDN